MIKKAKGTISNKLKREATGTRFKKLKGKDPTS